MSETKHTPTPWTTGPDLANCGGGQNILADTETENSVRIAHTSRVVYGGQELVGEPQAQVNAEFIVRAVNNHDGLLTALRDLFDLYDRGILRGDGGEVELAAHAAIMAIAKAEGR